VLLDVYNVHSFSSALTYLVGPQHERHLEPDLQNKVNRKSVISSPLLILYDFSYKCRMISKTSGY